MASPHIGHKLTLALYILRILRQEEEGKNELKDKHRMDAQDLTTRDIEKLSEKGKSVNTENPTRLGSVDPTVLSFLPVRL